MVRWLGIIVDGRTKAGHERRVNGEMKRARRNDSELTPIGPALLEKWALGYLERFASSAENLRRGVPPPGPARPPAPENPPPPRPPPPHPPARSPQERPVASAPL